MKIGNKLVRELALLRAAFLVVKLWFAIYTRSERGSGGTNDDPSAP
jgi:hypothetical protein